MTVTLLIIDSDTSLAAALATYLARQQFAVDIAGCEADAEGLFERHAHKIVLADPIFAGRVKGIALLRRFKADQPLTQLIVFTAEELLAPFMEQLGSDALGFLSKPVNGLALDHMLRQAREWISLKSKLDRYTARLDDLHTAQVSYQQLFDEVPCYISVQDRWFRITAANRLFKKDFGTQVGAFCYEVYKHRSTQCPNCPVADTFKDGKPHQTEEIVTSRSGRQYNVLTWTAPIRDERGNITQVMEMSTNITQIRKLQDHLVSLGLMLGSMSHGVKGMLTALDGGIYQLETGLKRQDPDRIQHAFDQIRQMTDRIRKMVLEILYYAKSRELQYREVDTHRLARTVVATVYPVAERHRVPLKTDIDPALGMCEADPNWLQAALVNFLENAVEACIHDRTQSDHEVWFQARPDGPDRICFEVIDNGMGMDRETQEKMFTLFFSSKGSKGTGLGMFIANHVITQHGGSIRVTSSPGRGSRFLILLPRHRPDKHAASELPTHEVPPRNPEPDQLHIDPPAGPPGAPPCAHGDDSP
jgi:signal transduction histidine kinase/response regulator of citrate/malate metabolism